MLFHHNSPDQTPNTEENKTRKAAIRPDGSYEIVFDGKTSDTDYSASGYNAYGFSANGSHKDDEKDPTPEESPKKNRNIPAIFLGVSILLTVFSILMSVGSFLMYRQETIHQTLGSKPANRETLGPWVNPFESVPTDAYAAATAKAIDSVVIITTEGGSGSGVIWASGDSYSYIVTCYHVIEGEKEIKITFQNEEVGYAELVGGDAKTDLAVLQIEKTGLRPIVLPNEQSEMALGQAVIAIGNPLGVLGNSVSDGILSSLARNVSIGGSSMRLLQTTAAVNHGNSGGGLFDLNGQLIGLVNAKISETSVEGIGFAIPYDTIKTVAGELIDKGYVSGRPSLGIATVMIDTTATYEEAIRQYPDLESYTVYYDFFNRPQTAAGLYVIDASTAKGYGEGDLALKFGDRITDIGTTSIGSGSDIQSALNGYDAGDTVQITFVRQNKKYITELVLGEVGK